MRLRPPPRGGEDASPVLPAALIRPAPAAEQDEQRGDRLVRLGRAAWALLGIVGVATLVVIVLLELAVITVPLLIALFPAAILAPLVARLQRLHLPRSAAALLALLLGLAVLAGIVAFLVPAVARELDGIATAAQEGVGRVQAFLASGPFGLDPIRLDDLGARVREQITSGGGSLGRQVLGYARTLLEGIAAILFGLVALFFYLKDGERIASWLRDLFPRRLRPDVAEIGRRSWGTVGAYIRGQLLIALVDAILIGIGILVLGVPLALPLTVIIFIGGLFPLIGAVVAGSLAVLVALATVGFVKALILVGVILVVQEVEGDLLAPIVLGRATALHPLAVLTALGAGALLLGVLGAFIAVPLAAAIARSVGYLRERAGDAGEGAGDEPAGTAAART